MNLIESSNTCVLGGGGGGGLSDDWNLGYARWLKSFWVTKPNQIIWHLVVFVFSLSDNTEISIVHLLCQVTVQSFWVKET